MQMIYIDACAFNLAPVRFPLSALLVSVPVYQAKDSSTHPRSRPLLLYPPDRFLAVLRSNTALSCRCARERKGQRAQMYAAAMIGLASLCVFARTYTRSQRLAGGQQGRARLFSYKSLVCAAFTCMAERQILEKISDSSDFT